MNKHYNSSSSYSESVGGTLPFLIDAVKYRVGGAKLANTMSKGEVIHCGTPVMYDAENHNAKILKVWKIKEVTVVDSTTVVEIYKNMLTPVLKADTVVMVAPSTISGTGKAAAVGTVSVNSSGNYEVTLTTASFDTLAANGYLVEASASGSGKAMYCEPNNMIVEDHTVGDNYTLIDVPYGFIHAYKNVIAPLPDVILNNLKDGVVFVWEYFNETSSI